MFFKIAAEISIKTVDTNTALSYFIYLPCCQNYMAMHSIPTFFRKNSSPNLEKRERQRQPVRQTDVEQEQEGREQHQ